MFFWIAETVHARRRLRLAAKPLRLWARLCWRRLRRDPPYYFHCPVLFGAYRHRLDTIQVLNAQTPPGGMDFSLFAFFYARGFGGLRAFTCLRAGGFARV